VNHSYVEVHQTPQGWFAYYKSALRRGRVTITDERGEPKAFPTQDKAKIAALESLVAEENRVDALRFDESQARETPKFYEPRSSAGKRQFATEQLKRGLKELIA
jgi:hypothetical protein